MIMEPLDLDKLTAYVMNHAHQCYRDDFPIESIEWWIRDYFHPGEYAEYLKEMLVSLKKYKEEK